MTERDVPWTKGPWPLKPTGDGKRILVGDGLVEGPNGYEVAEVYSDDCPRELAWANAHLIAAAPDLYAALDRLCVDGALTGLDQQAGWDVFFAQGRAALAKARSPS